MNTQQDSDRLIRLIEEGNIELIRQAILSGYDINHQIDGEITLLMVAASTGNLEVVKLLVKSGANVNQILDNGSIPLLCATNIDNLEVFNYLVTLAILETNKILLLQYVFDGQLDFIKSLINTGIDVDTCQEKGMTHENGRTALILAISEEYLEIVKILIESGADPNLRDEDSSDSPLIYAVRKQNTEIVDLLVKSGANINYQNTNGDTAISIAQSISNTKIIKILQG
jgi:ankyrin repeat protein